MGPTTNLNGEFLICKCGKECGPNDLRRCAEHQPVVHPRPLDLNKTLTMILQPYHRMAWFPPNLAERFPDDVVSVIAMHLVIGDECTKFSAVMTELLTTVEWYYVSDHGDDSPDYLDDGDIIRGDDGYSVINRRSRETDLTWEATYHLANADDEDIPVIWSKLLITVNCCDSTNKSPREYSKRGHYYGWSCDTFNNHVLNTFQLGNVDYGRVEWWPWPEQHMKYVSIMYEVQNYSYKTPESWFKPGTPYTFKHNPDDCDPYAWDVSGMKPDRLAEALSRSTSG